MGSLKYSLEFVLMLIPVVDLFSVTGWTGVLLVPLSSGELRNRDASSENIRAVFDNSSAISCVLIGENSCIKLVFKNQWKTCRTIQSMCLVDRWFGVEKRRWKVWQTYNYDKKTCSIQKMRRTPPLPNNNYLVMCPAYTRVSTSTKLFTSFLTPCISQIVRHLGLIWTPGFRVPSRLVPRPLHKKVTILKKWNASFSNLIKWCIFNS